MAVRRLVITADDLGRDPLTDQVIAELAAAGAITAASLLVTTPHADQAARAVHAAGITPHLHTCLVAESTGGPWRLLTDAPSLHEPDGTLRLADPLAELRAEEGEVLAELEAQLGWMHDRGLRPRAVDSHTGTLYGLYGGGLLAGALHWAARHGLAVRLPRDPEPLRHLDRPGAAAPRSSLLGPTEREARHRRAVDLADHLGVPIPAAILTNPLPARLLGSYEALRDRLLHGVARLPPGTSELFLHPSGEGPGIPPERAWEARLLRDAQWWDALASTGVELVDRW